MTDQVQPNQAKDTEDWTTGDEKITGPQKSYLTTLAQDAGEEIDTSEMTKAQASDKIEELQRQTGREGSAASQS